MTVIKHRPDTETRFMTELTTSTIAQAGSYLAAAARSSPDPAVALRCLAAADLLATVAPLETATDAPSSVQELIETALRLLAELPFETFATDPVRDAAAHARRALLLD